MVTPDPTAQSSLDLELARFAAGPLRLGGFAAIAFAVLLVLPGWTLHLLGISSALRLPVLPSIAVLMVGIPFGILLTKLERSRHLTPRLAQLAWFFWATAPAVFAAVLTVADPAQLGPFVTDLPPLIWAGMVALSVVLLRPWTTAVLGLWCGTLYFLIFTQARPHMLPLTGPEILVRELTGYGAAARRAGLMVGFGLVAAAFSQAFRATVIDLFRQRDLQQRADQERARSEAARAQAIAEHRQVAQISESKTRFLADLSHELRTPLSAILAHSSALAEDQQLPKNVRATADMLLGSGRHLADLVSDAMDTAMVETGRLELHPRPTDLRDLLGGLRSLFELQAQDRGVTLSTWLEAGVPACVVIDPKRTRQVLVNLISNALKHTRDGDVAVSISGEGPLVFTVRDTGRGIPLDEQAAVFEAYAQAGDSEQRAGGLGLGLAITREIVAAMGGEIDLQSTEGVGTAVHVSVPLVLPDRAVALAEPERITHRTAAEVEVALPPADTVSRLQEAALLGDMQAVERVLDELRGRTPFEPFVERMERLARAFDDEAILRLLTPSTQEPS